jgi:phage terminase large subunit
MNAVVSRLPWKQEIVGERTTVLLPYEFDWKTPDYQMVLTYRARRLVELRKNPKSFEKLKRFYKTNIQQMICDWGCTYDPRNIEIGLPATVPFILFPKQIDWVDWVIAHWHARKPGLTEKSRDCGVSWLAMCLSCELAKSYQGLPIGFGSATADKVDESDNPDCLFYKGRFYLNNLPWELRGGWIEKKHSFYMRLVFPETSSFIGGDSGDQIGRGGRRAIYFVDEAAHLMRPQKVESSLLSTTNCRMDISSVSGMANPFAQKRHKGKVDYFTFHWRDDPRKGIEWYEKLKGETDDVTLAQDVDINYLASTTGQVIPAKWVEAAIGAHIKLGIIPSGVRRGGFDVADGGNQTVFAGRHGVLLQDLIAWQASGNSDTYKSVVRAINICDEKDYNGFDYDADGIGASVRGDALNINTERRHVGLRWVYDEPFRGSGAVYEPEAEMVKERKNKDFFLNLKAQSWWALRIRFNNTWRAVNGLPDVDLDNIICIDPELENLTDLIMQLAQPTYEKNTVGKIVIDKTPDGSSSPDLADAVMIAFNPTNGMADIWAKLAQ